jgi:hypothetical protein
VQIVLVRELGKLLGFATSGCSRLLHYYVLSVLERGSHQLGMALRRSDDESNIHVRL